MSEPVGLYTAIDRLSDDVARGLARMLLTSDASSWQVADNTKHYTDCRVALGRLIPQINTVDGQQVARTIWNAMVPELTANKRLMAFNRLLEDGPSYAEVVLA
jgi:hypothetical protein